MKYFFYFLIPPKGSFSTAFAFNYLNVKTTLCRLDNLVCWCRGQEKPTTVCNVNFWTDWGKTANNLMLGVSHKIDIWFYLFSLNFLNDSRWDKLIWQCCTYRIYYLHKLKNSRHYRNISNNILPKFDISGVWQQPFSKGYTLNWDYQVWVPKWVKIQLLLDQIVLLVLLWNVTFVLLLFQKHLTNAKLHTN